METTITSIRIDNDVLKFLKKQANIERRTLSGMINKYLSDQKNRAETENAKK